MYAYEEEQKVDMLSGALEIIEEEEEATYDDDQELDLDFD